MIVKGDIIHGAQNSSTFDLFNANNRNRVVLELAGAGTHSYSRSSTAVPDLYQVVMNKGVSQANTFTFNQHFTIVITSYSIHYTKLYENVIRGFLLLSVVSTLR